MRVGLAPDIFESFKNIRLPCFLTADEQMKRNPHGEKIIVRTSSGEKNTIDLSLMSS